MIAIALACLFTVAVIATMLSLIDSWLKAKGAYAVLKREHALLKAGFVPQVHAHEVRLRKPARRTIAAATRPYAKRLPLPATRLAG